MYANKAVVDTNVIVSGLLKSNSEPAKVLNLIVQEKLILCSDSRIFDEYQKVLTSSKFNFPQNDVRNFLDYLKAISLMISPLPYRKEVIDIGDLPFIEVALTLKVPIITGNIRHYKNIEGLELFTPVEFIRHFVR